MDETSDEPFARSHAVQTWGECPAVSSPPNEYGLFEAAWLLATDRDVGRQFADLFIRSREALTFDELERLSELQNEVEADLRRKLVAGDLIATWGSPGGGARDTVHPERWRRARFDMWSSSATVGQTVLVDIVVTLAATEQAAGHTDEAGIIYRSGAPGRPTSKALVIEEMHRRQASGAGENKLATEASYLSAWLLRVHPAAPQMTKKSVEEAIRPEYRKLPRNCQTTG